MPNRLWGVGAMRATGPLLAVVAVAMLALRCAGQQQVGGACPHGVGTVVAQTCDPHTWRKCPKWMGINWFCGPTGSCDCSDPLTGTLAVDCNPPLDCSSGSMGRVVSQTCLSATRIPAEQWCSSRCFEQLQPMMQQCQDSLPPYVLSALGPAIARLDECGQTDVGVCVVPAPPSGGSPATPAVAACDIDRMITLCQGVIPSETDLSALCGAPCTRAMIACADDPEVVRRVDAAEIAALRSTKNSCAENAHAATGEGPAPGDGVCDLTLMTTLCDGRTAVGPQDTAGLCADPCAKEMVDCIDDPALVSPALEECSAHANMFVPSF